MHLKLYNELLIPAEKYDFLLNLQARQNLKPCEFY